MKTEPSGVRATSTAPVEHVARPIYGLQGTNLRNATTSACRTCGVPIHRTTVDDGLRGTWRHTEAAQAVPADTELLALVHEAHDRNLKYLAHTERLRLAYDASEAAWERRREEGATAHLRQSRAGRATNRRGLI